jgi:Adenylate and Guanylate cyclase catalytic domain
MAWNEEESRERVARRWEARDTEITVSKLGRDMNLENVTLKSGKLIQGVHLYVSVAGSGKLDALGDVEDAQSALQRLAIWQAEVAKMASAFDVPIVAFQGGRCHLLVYRPIDDDAALARKATLLAQAITYTTRDAFNPLFDGDLKLSARAAADIGQTVATRGGTRGDSELLFLGVAANRPAKLLGESRFVATDRLISALGDGLEYDAFEAGDKDASIVRVSLSVVEAAVAEDGIDWSVEKSADRLAADLEKWPKERFGLSGATELINPTALSRSNSKLVHSAVVLVDIDGFSDYVQEAETDEVKRDRILTLDAIRQEMREVLKVDYEGVRIQYQGDNMIGFVHLPASDEEKRAAAAADIAAGMQASMTKTLPDVVPDVGRLKVSIGVASGDTAISCLGPYAKRNALILGPAASSAERIQMRLPGGDTGLDSNTYSALSDEVQELYGWSESAKAWVATDLDASKLARAQEALASDGLRSVTPDGAGKFSIGGPAVIGETRKVRTIKPYADV